tara:strand:+ start:3433 stop:3765 length:333 start_codon:yes stop_codon:yes gene_type:complete
MNDHNDGELQEIVIDFTKTDNLSESYLRTFGSQIEYILRSMFGIGYSPVKITGTTAQIRSFARAIGNEKRYIASLEKHGLHNPKAMRSRHELERSIAAFERETGIKWPIG